MKILNAADLQKMREEETRLKLAYDTARQKMFDAHDLFARDRTNLTNKKAFHDAFGKSLDAGAAWKEAERQINQFLGLSA